MAEKLDGGAVLEAIRDLAGRLSSEKQVNALSESIKSSLLQIEERFAGIDRRLKALDARLEEQAEIDRKALSKLRDELLEKIDEIEVPEGGGGMNGDEAPKWVKDLLTEGKGWGKVLVGDDPKTLEAIRDRVRNWIKGAKKAAVEAADDE